MFRICLFTRGFPEPKKRADRSAEVVDPTGFMPIRFWIDQGLKYVLLVGCKVTAMKNYNKRRRVFTLCCDMAEKEEKKRKKTERWLGNTP